MERQFNDLNLMKLLITDEGRKNEITPIVEAIKANKWYDKLKEVGMYRPTDVVPSDGTDLFEIKDATDKQGRVLDKAFEIKSVKERFELDKISKELEQITTRSYDQYTDWKHKELDAQKRDREVLVEVFQSIKKEKSELVTKYGNTIEEERNDFLKKIQDTQNENNPLYDKILTVQSENNELSKVQKINNSKGELVDDMIISAEENLKRRLSNWDNKEQSRVIEELLKDSYYKTRAYYQE